MKNKGYFILIIILGCLLFIQTAYVISLERQQQVFMAKLRLGRPFSRMRLQDNLNISRSKPPARGEEGLNTSFTMRQTPKEYLIIMRLPGLSRDKISIELKNKYLAVSGAKDSRKEESGENYREEQSSSRSFTQVITLPDDARKEKITSEYKDGNLTIHIPRNAKAKNTPAGRKIRVN